MRAMTFGAGVFGELDALREHMNSLFRPLARNASLRAGTSGFPPLNIGSTDDRYEIVVFAPGLEAKDIQVSVEDSLLTIAGERSEKAEKAEKEAEGRTAHVRERPLGAFRRIVELPQDADPAQVQARYEDGCLRITVNKREASRARQIEVQ